MSDLSRVERLLRNALGEDGNIIENRHFDTLYEEPEEVSED